jgi:hypothetical protein
MPKQLKPAKGKAGWISSIPTGVTFASSLIGLLSATAGLWLLWPSIVESFGPNYQISYDYVVVPDTGLSCVAKHDATLEIGEKSIGLLQNACQKRVVSGVATNDVFRIWYIRVANSGPEIPTVSIVQPGGSSSFSLPAGDVTLVCLGYEGRPGRESKEWTLAKLELSDDEGVVQKTIAPRKAPADEQLKGATSGCAGVFVGYPPL